MFHDAPELIPPATQDCIIYSGLALLFSPYHPLGLSNAVSEVVTNSPDLLRIPGLNSTPRPLGFDLAVSLERHDNYCLPPGKSLDVSHIILIFNVSNTAGSDLRTSADGSVT